jgi:aminoglycoside 3-N-acetyltransferase
MVHSSLSSLGCVQGSADAVLDALVDVLGPRGLLVVPTHTWGTVCAQQPVFHETLSPSTVGCISEALRTRRGTVRSLHPTHSLAALGPGAVDFATGHEKAATPCPRQSPYGKLLDRKAQVLLIGVGLESFTMMHAFEEWAEVPWLFNRTEVLYVITRTGLIHRVVSRRHTNDPRNFPALEPLLVERGALTYGTAGNAKLRLIDVASASAILVPLLRMDPDVLLAVNSS